MSEKKEFFIHELKELGGIVLYLAVAFCLISTGRSLILIQVGINDFVHGYLKALVESLALGKIVMLAQNIPFLDRAHKRPLYFSASFKAVVMSVIVFFAGEIEEKIFAKHAADAQLKEDAVFVIAHLFGLFLVFFTLFVARGLDKLLGKGTLWKLFTQSSSELLPTSESGLGGPETK